MIQTDHKPLLGLLAENKPTPTMTSVRIMLLAIVLVIKTVIWIAWVDLTLILRVTEFSTMENHVFLTELELAQVTSIEVAYVTNCDPLSSKVRII